MNSKPSTHQQISIKTPASNMMFFDPSLIKAARNIYRNYCNINVATENKPVGIVINRDNFRGQLAFSPKPILLPRECFIPLKQIEAEAY
ncbi:MAG: hypothetical protein AAFQ80_20625 [Cyanobacteria bacterium J06621_8]